MALTDQRKPSKNEMETIVKELNSLTSLLEIYQHKKACFKPNNVSASAQNFAAPASRSLHNNCSSKRYVHFPTSFKNPMSVIDNQKKVNYQTAKLTYNSQYPNKSNKFTFVGKKINTSLTNVNNFNHLQRQSSVKSPIADKSTSQLGHVIASNVNGTVSLATKYINLETIKVNRAVSLASSKCVDLKNLAKKPHAETTAVNRTVLLTSKCVDLKNLNKKQNPDTVKRNRIVYLTSKHADLKNGNTLPKSQSVGPFVQPKRTVILTNASGVNSSGTLSADRNCAELNSTSKVNLAMAATAVILPKIVCDLASNSVNLTSNEKKKSTSLHITQCNKPVAPIVFEKDNSISQPDVAKNINSGTSHSVNKLDTLSCASSQLSLNSNSSVANTKPKLLTRKLDIGSNMINSKTVNNFPKCIMSSKYKIVNKKNSPFMKRLKHSASKKDPSSVTIETKAKLVQSKILTTLRANSSYTLKKSPKNNSLLFSRKKNTVKRQLVCSKFKIVNKNGSFTFKSKETLKSSSKVNTVAKSPSVMRLGMHSTSKYKIVNQKKATRAKYVPTSGEVKLSPSKYKFVKEEKIAIKKLMSLSSDGSLNENKVSDCLQSKGNCKSMTDIDVCLEEEGSQNKEQIANGLLKQKINQLKFIKNSDYEGYDLTDLSPDELVSMDTASLLKLSALLKSSNNKRQSLVKKSKYKLVSKRPSLSKKVVKMIKAKYQVKNKRNCSANWRTGQRSHMYKGSAHGSNLGYHPFANGYQKHAFKSQQFRRALPRKDNGYKKTNCVMIGDIRYRVSRTKMTKTAKKSLTPKHTRSVKGSRIIIVRGERFKMDPSGKSLRKLSNENTGSNEATLKRIDLGGKTYINAGSGILMQSASPQIRNLTSRMLHRSIQTVWASTAKKKGLKKTNVYCMFFNRFGKCNHEKDCRFVHDPSKIAVCTRFLRGTCKADNCPFSHEKSPGKMAICTFFLQGLCTNKECPYRHELLNPDAKLCRPFVQGYCSLGIKCTKAHILVCPQHIRGQCEKGASCAFPHPPQREKEDISGKNENVIPDVKVSKESPLENDLSKDDGSEDETMRYFDLKSFLSKGPLCRKRRATSVHSSGNKKNKSTHCKPQRDKVMDCPLFIPLSFDDDSS